MNQSFDHVRYVPRSVSRLMQNLSFAVYLSFSGMYINFVYILSGILKSLHVLLWGEHSGVHYTGKSRCDWHREEKEDQMRTL